VSEAAATRDTLRVGAAFPDPPFEVAGDRPTGLDVEFSQALAREMGLVWQSHRFEGADFNGVFAGLGEPYDVVASGATVTAYRKTLARWCDPYLRSGQSLVVDRGRTPDVRSTDDLHDIVLGVQEGNTSEPVERQTPLCNPPCTSGDTRSTPAVGSTSGSRWVTQSADPSYSLPPTPKASSTPPLSSQTPALERVARSRAAVAVFAASGSDHCRVIEPNPSRFRVAASVAGEDGAGSCWVELVVGFLFYVVFRFGW
jgi:hypothetical protein